MTGEFRSTDPVSNARRINNDSFERLRARKTRRTFDEWVMILFVILFLLALLFAVCGLIFFRAKSVEVRGCHYYAHDEILSRCGITEDDNLFFINEEELEQRLTLQFPYIESVRVRRVLPTTVILEVKEDTPGYLCSVGEEYLLLSRTLRVLRRADSQEAVCEDTEGLTELILPPITYAVVGRPLRFERETTHAYMLDFLNLLHESEYAGQIDRVSAKSKFRISVYLCGYRYKVVFGSAEEAGEKLLFFTNIKNQKLPLDACAVVDVSDLERAFVSIRENPIED